jgi:hypothetical protein
LPIFDDLVPVADVWPANARWPIRRARALIAMFRRAFPDIHYDLYWETRLMNAQAYIGPAGRSVRLYGGLGRHRKIRVEGLAFALMHETGHHLAGPPLHPFYSSISSEERANEWAIAVGLPALFGDIISRRYAIQGQRQLSAIWSQHSLRREK